MNTTALPQKEDNWADKSTFKCLTCMYYQGKNEEVGRCHYYPPQSVKGFTAVYPSDWCGQHKIK